MKLLIAFPSLSTADFGFPVSDAIEIIYDSVVEFLRDETQCHDSGNIGLIFVVEPDSPTLLLPKMELLRKLQEDKNGMFFCFEGEICKLSTTANLGFILAIVNPANHRFTCRGGRINQIIHSECDYGNFHDDEYALNLIVCS